MAVETLSPPAAPPIAAAAGERTQASARPLAILALAMLVAELWLTTRYYRGVVGDARFYMLQALRELDPGRFAGDLYFRFGSQDSFTVFTRLYAPLVARLGVGAAGMACTIAGQVLWLGGLVYCVFALIPRRREALLAVAAAIILPSASPLFGYGEEFVTPRLFAEGISLLALGLLLRRHTWPALAALGFAASVHPLTTLPAAGFALIYLALGRRLWWAVIAASAAAAVGLSFAGVPPFANLRATFDPAWFDIVRVRDPQCFIASWPPDAYFRLLGTVALAVLGLALAEPPERRFLTTALAVGLGGLAAALVGGDLVRDVLVVQLQPWRSLWLLTLIAQLATVPIVIRLRRRGDADLVALMVATALGADVAAQFTGAIAFVAGPLMATATALALWQLRTGRQPPALVRGLGLFAVAIVIGASIVFTAVPTLMMRAWPQEFGRRLCSLAVVAVSAVVIAVWFGQLDRPRRRTGAGLAAVTAVLLAVALANWDGRSPWTRFIESPAPAPASLATLLPQDAAVYWEGGPELLWFKLRRASYFSCDQGTGAVFFRDTAIAFRHRAESLRPLRVLDFGRYVYCPSLPGASIAERTRAELRSICRQEQRLDYLVLTRPVAGVGATVWHAPIPFEDVRLADGRLAVTDIDTFYVYSCAALSRLPAEMPGLRFPGLAAASAMAAPSG